MQSLISKGALQKKGPGIGVSEEGRLIFESNKRFLWLLETNNLKDLDIQGRLEWLRGFVFQGHEWQTSLLKLLGKYWADSEVVQDYIQHYAQQ